MRHRGRTDCATTIQPIIPNAAMRRQRKDTNVSTYTTTPVAIRKSATATTYAMMNVEKAVLIAMTVAVVIRKPMNALTPTMGIAAMRKVQQGSPVPIPVRNATTPMRATTAKVRTITIPKQMQSVPVPKSVRRKPLIQNAPYAKLGGANIDLCKGAKQEPDEDKKAEKDDPAEEEKAAETKLLITAVAEPDSEITQQQLLVGASWEQIVFPDTLTVTVKELTAKTDTEGKSEAEGTESQLTLTGITWEIDPKESDGDIFDSSEDSSGKCYVYVPVLPDTDADGNELCLDEDAELPMIYVLIGEHGVMPIPAGMTKTYKTKVRRLI